MTEFLAGERCYLRALSRDDLKGPWGHWLNDPRVTEHMVRGAWPTTMEANAAYYESVAQSDGDLVLAIIERQSERHVGNVGLHGMDPIHRSAEFGILIGDTGVWGKGIGSEATRLICGHGFDRLNLARIWLGVFADHTGAIRVYEKVGFQVEGRLREAFARNGSRVDQLIMGLLPQELVRSES